MTPTHEGDGPEELEPHRLNGFSLDKKLFEPQLSSYEISWLTSLIEQCEARVMDGDLVGSLRILKLMKEDFAPTPPSPGEAA